MVTISQVGVFGVALMATCPNVILFTAKTLRTLRLISFCFPLAVPCPPSRAPPGIAMVQPRRTGAQARQAGLNGKGKIIYLCALCGSAVHSGNSKGMQIFIVIGPYQNKMTTSPGNQTARDFSLYSPFNLT